MGLCSSSQKRLAVTPEEHRFKQLQKYSDTQAHELCKKNAQIAEQCAQIHKKDKELVQTRKDLERTADRLKAQEALHESSEQRHLNDFQEIVRAVAAAAPGFKEPGQAASKQSLCCHPEAELP